MRVVLALFGLALMALSISGYFLDSQATPGAEEISVQEPESAIAVSSTSGAAVTSVQSTVTSQQVTQQSPTLPQNFLYEDRIPNDTSMTITVNNGEIHAVTAGQICVMDVCLPGGVDRGSVVVLLPAAEYELTGLVPMWNWHGAYYGTPDQWRILAEQLAKEQKIPGTCSDGDGCSIVDVLVIDPNGIVDQYVDED